MKKEIYVNDDAINIILPKNTTLYCSSGYSESEKLVLVGCKREPKLVKTEEGWEVLL